MTKPVSPTLDAAFSIGPLAKAYPQFVLRFVLLSAGLSVVQTAALVPSNIGPVMTEVQAITARAQEGALSEAAAQAAMMDAYGMLQWGPFMIAFVLIVLTNVMLLAMALRKTVRNEEPTGLGIGWSRDETSLLVDVLVLAGLFVLVAIAAGVVGGLMAVFGGGAAAIGSTLTTVVMMLALILAAGRFGLWGVVTVAAGRSSVRDTWRASKEGFWGLLGAYVLWMVVAGIGQVLWNGLMQIVAGALGARMGVGVPADLATLFSPGWLIYLFASGLAGGLVWLGLVCVGAFTWHARGAGKVLDRAV